MYVYSSQVFWYARDHMPAEKIWFLILIYTVLVLQCLTSDIFVLVNVQNHTDTTTTTSKPHPSSYHHINLTTTQVDIQT